MRLNISFLSASLLCLAAVSGCERQVSFSEDIQPMLKASCAGCHSGFSEGEAATGLNVTNYADLMQGTRLGPVVVPGSAASSTLYLVIAGETAPEIQMPPHHEASLAEGRGAPLTDKQIELVKTWIDQGAPDN